MCGRSIVGLCFGLLPGDPEIGQNMVVFLDVVSVGAILLGHGCLSFEVPNLIGRNLIQRNE